MRIHTNLTESAVRDMARSVPGVYIVASSEHGSRKRERGIDIKLSGSSPRRTMSKDDYAATWDEWGVFIAKVFEADPNAIVGQYESEDMFGEVTKWRFEDVDFVPTPGHAHKWDYAYAYNFECKCGAEMTTAPYHRA